MNLLLLFVIPAVISFLFIPLVMKFAIRFGYVDNPKIHSYPLHKKILPRAGGIPIFIAFFISCLLFLPLQKNLIGLLSATFIMVLVNTLDDKYKIHPLIRLTTGFLAASIIVISGVGISSLDFPIIGQINLNVIDIPIYLWGEHHFFVLADLLALFWIVSLSNFVNWSAGVDGQLPLVIIISLSFMALLASQFLSYDSSQMTIIQICLITIGAVLPFLIFNWSPAHILPGDGAPTFLALIIATLAIYSGSKTATAILVLGVPIMDGLWTIGRRLYQGKLPIWGDQKHLHHKLLNLGWSHQKIAIFYGTITFILGLIAVYSSKVTKTWAIMATALFLIILTGILGILVKQKPQTK